MKNRFITTNFILLVIYSLLLKGKSDMITIILLIHFATNLAIAIIAWRIHKKSLVVNGLISGVLLLGVGLSACSLWNKTDNRKGEEYISFDFASVSTTAPVGDDADNFRSVRVTWEPRFDYIYFPTNKWGFGTGALFQNNGFIYNNYDGTREKFRTVNFAIPLQVYYGLGKSFTLFGGYQIGLPLTYRNVVYSNSNDIVNERKEWFSGKPHPFTGTYTAGVYYIEPSELLVFRLGIGYVNTPFFRQNYANQINFPNHIRNLSISFGVTINLNWGNYPQHTPPDKLE